MFVYRLLTIWRIMLYLGLIWMVKSVHSVVGVSSNLITPPTFDLSLVQHAGFSIISIIDSASIVQANRFGLVNSLDAHREIQALPKQCSVTQSSLGLFSIPKIPLQRSKEKFKSRNCLTTLRASSSKGLPSLGSHLGSVRNMRLCVIGSLSSTNTAPAPKTRETVRIRFVRLKNIWSIFSRLFLLFFCTGSGNWVFWGW